MYSIADRLFIRLSTSSLTVVTKVVLVVDCLSKGTFVGECPNLFVCARSALLEFELFAFQMYNIQDGGS